MNSNMNPFKSVGKVVSGDLFIGRRKEILELENRVFGSPLANASIVGLPRVGKSSLMHKVFIDRKDFLWESEKCLVVWYTFMEYSGRAEDVIIAILQCILRALGKKGVINEELNEYCRRASSENIRDSQFATEVIAFFDELTDNEISVIICIDEFDYSKDIFSYFHFQLLRYISNEFANVAFVTTSRRSILDIEKDSGGGSVFYETDYVVFLKPFTDEEVDIQRSLVGELSESDEVLLDNACGNHPYLNALVLNQYYMNKDMEASVDESYQSILSYYNRLFEKVLKKDKLDIKVINIYSGFLDAVSQDEEEYILKRYGLFKAISPNNDHASSEDTEMKQFEYVPFCQSFDEYMRQLYRKNPYKLLWPRAERSIKLIISKALEEIHGPKHADWYLPVKSIILSYYNLAHYNKLVNQMENELIHYPDKSSDNIVDQFYPKDFFPFIKNLWDPTIKNILGKDLIYWEDRFELIAGKVRNPESHSRLLLDEETIGRATIICEEIIKAAEQTFGKVE